MGDRRLRTLIAGLSPASAWWSSFRGTRRVKPPPLEGAAADTYLHSIAAV